MSGPKPLPQPALGGGLANRMDWYALRSKIAQWLHHSRMGWNFLVTTEDLERLEAALSAQSPPPADDDVVRLTRAHRRGGGYDTVICGEEQAASYEDQGYVRNPIPGCGAPVQSPPRIMGEGLVERIKQALSYRLRGQNDDYNLGFDNGIKAAEVEVVQLLREELATPSLPEGMNFVATEPRCCGGGEYWIAEAQVVGGHYVAAEVYGDTEEDVAARVSAVTAALNRTSAPDPEGMVMVPRERLSCPQCGGPTMFSVAGGGGALCSFECTNAAASPKP